MKLVKIDQCADCGSEQVLGYRFPNMIDLCPFCYGTTTSAAVAGERMLMAQMMNIMFRLLRTR